MGKRKGKGVASSAVVANCARMPLYSTRLALCACLGMSGGCQDARFKAKQDARDEHVRMIAEWYHESETGRPTSIDDNWKLIETQRLQHVKRLDATKLMIKEAQLEDQRQWHEGKPARRETVRSVFSGRPEHIQHYWHHLGY
jgi:hypothetical protein